MDERQLITLIQEQLLATARRQYETVKLPPFNCFINPDEPASWASYAIPHHRVDGDIEAALDRMVDWYHEHRRTPRLEYVEAFAPALGPVLEAYGFELEAKNQLMVMTTHTFKPARLVAGLSIVPLGRYPALSLVQQAVGVLERGFGAPDDLHVSDSRARAFWNRFGSTRFFLAFLDGEAVSVGSLTPSWNGAAEIAGIATLERYRRRGIASALTAHMSAAGLAQGLAVLFLTAGDARAGRVYEGIGFQAIGSGLAYYFPDHR